MAPAPSSRHRPPATARYAAPAARSARPWRATGRRPSAPPDAGWPGATDAPNVLEENMGKIWGLMLNLGDYDDMMFPLLV